jgi:hypothetical protein
MVTLNGLTSSGTTGSQDQSQPAGGGSYMQIDQKGVIHHESAKAYTQIDDQGKIVHQSPGGDHKVTIDEQGKKVTVEVPADQKHFVYLGGDGSKGMYDVVTTPSGPSINVLARIG